MTALRALVLAHAVMFDKAYFAPNKIPDNERNAEQEFQDGQVVARLCDLIEVFQIGMSNEEAKKAKYGEVN